MKLRTLAYMAGLGLALLASCSDHTGVFRNAVTGDECTPDPQTYVPPNKGAHGNGGQNSPTGIPGDNMDDLHSGMVDCLGDGDSGQGNDDRKCHIPGCDADLCCDGDMVPPPDGDDGDDQSDESSGGDDAGGGDTAPDAGTTTTPPIG